MWQEGVFPLSGNPRRLAPCTGTRIHANRKSFGLAHRFAESPFSTRSSPPPLGSGKAAIASLRLALFPRKRGHCRRTRGKRLGVSGILCSRTGDAGSLFAAFLAVCGESRIPALFGREITALKRRFASLRARPVLKTSNYLTFIFALMWIRVFLTSS